MENRSPGIRNSSQRKHPAPEWVLTSVSRLDENDDSSETSSKQSPARSTPLVLIPEIRSMHNKRKSRCTENAAAAVILPHILEELIAGGDGADFAPCGDKLPGYPVFHFLSIIVEAAFIGQKAERFVQGRVGQFALGVFIKAEPRLFPPWSI